MNGKVPWVAAMAGDEVMVQVAVRMAPTLHQRALATARNLGVSFSALVRTAVELALRELQGTPSREDR